MKPVALKRLANLLLGSGPYRAAPFAGIAAARMSDIRQPVHRPEHQAAVVATAPADAFFAAESHPLLGQRAEPEMIAGAPRYRAAGLCVSLPRELWLLDDAAVAGADGAVWCPRTRTLVAETGRNWFFGSAEHPLLSAPRFPPPAPLAGLTLHLGTLNAEGFYHFLLESLPKLALARPWLPQVSHILANGRPGGFQEKWLRLAGIDPGCVRWLDGFSHFRCDQLLFARTLALDLRPTPWIVAQLRDLLPPPVVPGGRRLWITRAAAGSRHLIWEEQLLAALPGFERIDLAALEPQAQIALMASAAVVAGPHGAGFANLVFCTPGARAIELMPGLKHVPLYARLAAAAGLHHAWLAADFSQPADVPRLATAINGWLDRTDP